MKRCVLCGQENHLEIEPWLQNPWREMVERENPDLHHMFVVYNKLSIFITEAIWPFKYMHYSDMGICIMLT